MLGLKIAWRNIWRNKRRTTVTATAIALNTAILMLLFGLMNGMKRSSVKNVTDLTVGEVQVHAPKYRIDRSMFRAIPNPEKILDRAKSLGVSAAPRAYGYGLVSIGSKSAGAQFWGVDPKAELETFTLAKHLSSGSFLSAEPSGTQRMGKSPIKELVLGRKLARSLHARIGTEIIAVVQGADGSVGNELFTVTGILKSCGEEIDRSAAIIKAVDFEDLFVSQGRIHEIALNSGGRLTPEGLAKALAQSAPKMEVMTWRQILPAFSAMINMLDGSMILFSFIFFLAAGLGVLNTMLMATFERIREFGVLKALGATPWRILRGVSTEAFVMAVFASLLGSVVGIASMYYFHRVGLDLSFAGGDISFSGVAFDPVWRSTMDASSIVGPVISMWFVSVLAALYPGVKVARIDAVTAMNHV